MLDAFEAVPLNLRQLFLQEVLLADLDLPLEVLVELETAEVLADRYGNLIGVVLGLDDEGLAQDGSRVRRGTRTYLGGLPEPRAVVLRSAPRFRVTHPAEVLLGLEVAAVVDAERAGLVAEFIVALDELVAFGEFVVLFENVLDETFEVVEERDGEPLAEHLELFAEFEEFLGLANAEELFDFFVDGIDPEFLGLEVVDEVDESGVHHLHLSAVFGLLLEDGDEDLLLRVEFEVPPDAAHEEAADEVEVDYSEFEGCVEPDVDGDDGEFQDLVSEVVGAEVRAQKVEYEIPDHVDLLIFGSGYTHLVFHEHFPPLVEDIDDQYAEIKEDDKFFDSLENFIETHEKPEEEDE